MSAFSERNFDTAKRNFVRGGVPYVVVNETRVLVKRLHTERFEAIQPHEALDGALEVLEQIVGQIQSLEKPQLGDARVAQRRDLIILDEETLEAKIVLEAHEFGDLPSPITAREEKM